MVAPNTTRHGAVWQRRLLGSVTVPDSCWRMPPPASHACLCRGQGGGQAAGGLRESENGEQWLHSPKSQDLIGVGP